MLRAVAGVRSCMRAHACMSASVRMRVHTRVAIEHRCVHARTRMHTHIGTYLHACRARACRTHDAHMGVCVCIRVYARARVRTCHDCRTTPPRCAHNGDMPASSRVCAPSAPPHAPQPPRRRGEAAVDERSCCSCACPRPCRCQRVFDQWTRPRCVRKGGGRTGGTLVGGCCKMWWRRWRRAGSCWARPSRRMLPGKCRYREAQAHARVY